MDSRQKKDINLIFEGWKNAGNLDYVSCWYKKASDLMAGTSIRAALVSTNSVTQGEAVANLWKPLFANGVHIDFAHRNFPWPNPTDAQKAKIEQKAQAILDARALYPDSSLADLYDGTTMPPELRKAHQDNDRAVMAAYGFSVKNMTEASCVVALMRMYQKFTESDRK